MIRKLRMHSMYGKIGKDTVSAYPYTLIQVDPEQDFETYCYDCKELRLNMLRVGKPRECGNCKSTRIEVGCINDPRLTRLKQQRA